jgi:hypothetical protein
MAEKSLYGNDNEPDFPFEAVAPFLVPWLPAFLASQPSKPSGVAHDSLTALLDVILVYARVRTAALHKMQHWNICQSLVSHLNNALEHAGPADSNHHRLELVRRNPRNFFIVCSNSPRFHWKTLLTHLEVGQNLDYSGAGHFDHPNGPLVKVQFVERTTMRQLYAEMVLLQSLEEKDHKERFQKINDMKEEMYNHVMETFGLPYRFKWIQSIDEQSESESIKKTITDSTPPTPSWWERNAYKINSLGVQTPFCDFESKYRENWALIQYLYRFSQKNVQGKYFPLRKISKFEVFWTTIESKFEEIRQELHTEMTTEQIDTRITQLQIDFKIVEEIAELYDQSELLVQSVPKWYEVVERMKLVFVIRTTFAAWRVRLFLVDLGMRLFQRQKLRQPLVHQLLPVPSETGQRLLVPAWFRFR